MSDTPETFDGAPLGDLEHVDEHSERRIQITNLAAEYLNLFNPGKKDEAERLFKQVASDVYSDKPILRRSSEYASIKGRLEGFEDAMHIARYYWDSREDPNVQSVPERVVEITEDGDHSQLDINPDRKVLAVVMDPDTLLKRHKHYKFASGGSSPEPPDVYLKHIQQHYGRLGEVFKDKSLKGRIVQGRNLIGSSTFSLEGANNLLVGANYATSSGDLARIDLSCTGSLALLPGTFIRGGTAQGKTLDTQIKFHVPFGDITQEDSTRIAVHEISCQKYVLKKGGTIEIPANGSTVVHNFGPFENQGGRIPAYPLIEFKNYGDIDPQDLPEKVRENATAIGLPSGEVDRLVQLAAEKRQQRVETAEIAIKDAPVHQSATEAAVEQGDEDLAEDADLDTLETPDTPEKLAEMFDLMGEEYLKNEINRTDGVKVRGYDYPIVSGQDSRRYTEFLTYAVSAGWHVEHAQQVGTTMKIILEKR